MREVWKNEGVQDMTSNHPAHPVIWDKTVEATGLTKREWLMAHAPVPYQLAFDAVKKTGRTMITTEYVCKTQARLARIWADAIIKEAARDE